MHSRDKDNQHYCLYRLYKHTYVLKNRPNVRANKQHSRVTFLHSKQYSSSSKNLNFALQKFHMNSIHKISMFCDLSHIFTKSFAPPSHASRQLTSLPIKFAPSVRKTTRHSRGITHVEYCLKPNTGKQTPTFGTTFILCYFYMQSKLYIHAK